MYNKSYERYYVFFFFFCSFYEEVDYDGIKMDILMADIDIFSSTYTPEEVFNFLKKNCQFFNSHGKNIGIDLAVPAFNRHPNRKSYLIATQIINKIHKAIKQISPKPVDNKKVGFLDNLLRKIRLFIAYLKQKLKNLIS